MCVDIESKEHLFGHLDRGMPRAARMLQALLYLAGTACCTWDTVGRPAVWYPSNRLGRPGEVMVTPGVTPNSGKVHPTMRSPSSFVAWYLGCQK